MKLSKLQIGFFSMVAVVYIALAWVIVVPNGIENIADMEVMSDGGTVVAWYDDDKVQIDILHTDGSVTVLDNLKREQRQGVISIVDIAVDADNLVYLLVNYLDAETGAVQLQGMLIYDSSKWLNAQVNSLVFATENNLEYRWIESSSSSLSMISINDAGTQVTRELFDLTQLTQGVLSSKGSKSYLISASEGIYEVEPIGTSLAYMTMSGKVYLATDSTVEATEIYPARALVELMYPTFMYAQSDTILLIGEQSSGDLLLLDIESGETEVFKSGTEPFSGLSSYAPEDVLMMSVYDASTFAAVVKNETTGYYEILFSHQYDVSILTSLDGGIAQQMGRVVGIGVLLLIGCILFSLVLRMMRKKIIGSRSIRSKLIFSTIPILAVAIGLLGYFTYWNYQQSILESFYKQIEDEGNVLAALFGTDSFEEIEFPYDYPDEAYQYLSQQMQTSDSYTRTGYYENGVFYIGVDTNNPCSYYLDTLLNTDVLALYEQATYTGKAQTGIISDENGRRLTCVTPIGGSNSTTVYLLETSVSIANVTQYTDAYLKNFAMIAGTFILIVSALMVVLIVNILHPLREMKEGLEAFATGDRAVRLNVNTSDEFSDISRVFNKLVGDVDLQLFELKQVSEIYHRFVPQQMLRLLDKQNLGSIELGSNVEGEYVVVLAELRLSNVQTTQSMGELTNLFFNVVQEVCGQSKTATLISDSANLRRLCVLCPQGAADAVEIAMACLARIDATNTTLPIQMQMDVAFLVDKAEIYYGICGDENRLMPALISPKIDWLASCEPLLAQIASRLIVTELACKELTVENYYMRFIGTLTWDETAYGLYDFYDSTPPEQTRLIHANLATFDKAMELYQKERYYEAKNMFVIVLRENRFDNVARYYLFECEKNLRK